MKALIDLQNVTVNGIDTHARAQGMRQWILGRQKIKAIKIPILQDVTFRAKPGDRIGVLGSNGSGKSSLLKVISGNYPIHNGRREVTGKIAPLIEMGAGFDGELTGRRNIKLSFAYRGKLREYSKEIEETIIDFSELAQKIDLPLKTYSSGMVSRLAFASAIFQNPDILLLDEIFAAGDAGFVEKSKKMMQQKWNEVQIAIFVSHDTREILSLCNKCYIMQNGRIIAQGEPQEMVEKFEKEILHI